MDRSKSERNGDVHTQHTDSLKAKMLLRHAEGWTIQKELLSIDRVFIDHFQEMGSPKLMNVCTILASLD